MLAKSLCDFVDNIYMPRSIGHYQKSTEPQDTPQEQKKGKSIQIVPVAIIVVFALFFLNVGSDTLKQVAVMEQSLAEQAKVCMAEFSKKGCDSLRLTDDCRRLLQCVQKEDLTPSSRMINYFEVVSNEILEDYPLPSVFAMLLLLCQLIQTLKQVRQPDVHGDRNQ